MSRASDARPLTIGARLIRETAEAALVFQGDEANAVWLPLSQITMRKNGMRALGRELVTITLPTWLAREKNLMAEPGPAQGALL